MSEDKMPPVVLGPPADVDDPSGRDCFICGTDTNRLCWCHTLQDDGRACRCDTGRVREGTAHA